MINNLSTGNAVSADNSFFISQWNDESKTSYHRRPFSTLWSYINNKCKTVFVPINHASTNRRTLKNIKIIAQKNGKK